MKRDLRQMAQHYLSGLRIAAWFIRHGFKKDKVKKCVLTYERIIRPFLYEKTK